MASYSEFEDTIELVKEKHSIMHAIMSIGYPAFSAKDCPTACIEFDHSDDRVRFVFNPDFWDSLSQENRGFVVSHECLHVLLNHGERTQGLNPLFANIAADLSINHMLVERFRFSRNKDLEGFMWVDKVFKEPFASTVPTNKNFEYYYDLMEQNPNQVNEEIKEMVAESEAFEKSMRELREFINSPGFKKKMKEVASQNKENYQEIDELTKELLAREGEGNLEAGTGAGALSRSIYVEIHRKRKWETVIKNWVKKRLSEDVPKEQWARKSRRFTTLPGSMMLPTDLYEENYKKDKIDLMFFLDTSGSCYHLSGRFLKAAKSIPTDRFNIHPYCFDTSTYKMSKEDLAQGNLFGFGGTTFTCIENEIQRRLSEGTLTKYPDAVFIVTDGYGNKVKPQKCKNWHWFLSTTYRDCIPETCNVYNLANYE